VPLSVNVQQALGSPASFAMMMSAGPTTPTAAVRAALASVNKIMDPDPASDDAATVTLFAVQSQCEIIVSSSMMERVFVGRARPLMSGMRGRMW
jgi:hypothetical protein